MSRKLTDEQKQKNKLAALKKKRDELKEQVKRLEAEYKIKRRTANKEDKSLDSRKREALKPIWAKQGEINREEAKIRKAFREANWKLYGPVFKLENKKNQLNNKLREIDNKITSISGGPFLKKQELLAAIDKLQQELKRS